MFLFSGRRVPVCSDTNADENALEFISRWNMPVPFFMQCS